MNKKLNKMMVQLNRIFALAKTHLSSYGPNPVSPLRSQFKIPLRSKITRLNWMEFTRRFRRYLREKFDVSLNHKKGYIHWIMKSFILNVQIFMKRDFKLPIALQDYSSIIKILTLLFPMSTRQPVPGLTQEVDRMFFARVFRENNCVVRFKFF